MQDGRIAPIYLWTRNVFLYLFTVIHLSKSCTTISAIFICCWNSQEQEYAPEWRQSTSHLKVPVDSVLIRWEAMSDCCVGHNAAWDFSLNGGSFDCKWALLLQTIWPCLTLIQIIFLGCYLMWQGTDVICEMFTSTYLSQWDMFSCIIIWQQFKCSWSIFMIVFRHSQQFTIRQRWLSTVTCLK